MLPFPLHLSPLDPDLFEAERESSKAQVGSPGNWIIREAGNAINRKYSPFPVSFPEERELLRFLLARIGLRSGAKDSVLSKARSNRQIQLLKFSYRSLIGEKKEESKGKLKILV